MVLFCLKIGWQLHLKEIGYSKSLLYRFGIVFQQWIVLNKSFGTQNGNSRRQRSGVYPPYLRQKCKSTYTFATTFGTFQV